MICVGWKTHVPQPYKITRIPCFNSLCYPIWRHPLPLPTDCQLTTHLFFIMSVYIIDYISVYSSKTINKCLVIILLTWLGIFHYFSLFGQVLSFDVVPLMRRHNSFCVLYSSFFLFVFVCQCLFTFSLLLGNFCRRIWFPNADTSYLDRLIPWASPETNVLSRIMPFCVMYSKTHDAARYIHFLGPRQIRRELPFFRHRPHERNFVKKNAAL